MPEDDRAFALRLARSCARNPVALERMSYDPALEQVTYRSDKADGPTAGTATVDPLEFLARLVTHILDPGPVMLRYYGWYASRRRGMRLRHAHDAAEAPVAIIDPVDWSLRAARFRRAELLRRIFAVGPARLSPVPGTAAHRGREHRSRRDQPDPRASGPESGPTPPVAEPATAIATGTHPGRGRVP